MKPCVEFGLFASLNHVVFIVHINKESHTLHIPGSDCNHTNKLLMHMYKESDTVNYSNVCFMVLLSMSSCNVIKSMLILSILGKRSWGMLILWKQLRLGSDDNEYFCEYKPRKVAMQK